MKMHPGNYYFGYEEHKHPYPWQFSFVSILEWDATEWSNLPY